MYDLEHMLATAHAGTAGLHNTAASHHASLGQTYLLDETTLSAVSAASLSGAKSTTTTTSATTGSPAHTLVGASTGMQIDLVWDSSVQTASNWSAIEAAVVSAAKVFTNGFSNHMLVTLHIGLGEVNGASMPSNTLGESQSVGYIVNYSTMLSALKSGDAALVSSGLVSSSAFTANSAYSSANFFMTSAQAKALGLVSATGTSVDGYVGLSTNSAIAWSGTPGTGKYDAVGVAAHEISEVLGRIAMVGQTLGTYKNTFTGLDLFRYSAKNTAALTGSTASYFSVNSGSTALTAFNSSSSGDYGDWANLTANRGNAFNAFASSGLTNTVTATDMLEMAVLGYKLVKAPAAVAA